MGKIIKLDKNLANQISAGEVVERPISIIKELLENSIDAGATNIKIELTAGGKEKIVITDNGHGIEKDDLPLAVEKYSTSKIKSLKDLYNVMTFGFRGEALASIASVSNTTIISKTEDSISGYKIEINGGETGEIVECGAENGTKIIVKNLFHNTPARLNYLKTDRTEYSHISEFVNNMALSYPEVGFELINEGKTVSKYNQDDNLQTRIYNIYGDDFSSNMFDLSFEMPGIKVNGFATNPDTHFQNRNRQVIFVNNRVIKSPLISKAIHQSYNRFIPHSCHPGFVVLIEVDPTLVDVNVHPRKMEVRFSNEQDIYRAVYHAIFDKLDKHTLAQNMSTRENTIDDLPTTSFSSFKMENKTPETPKYHTSSGTRFTSYSPYKEIKFDPNQGRIGSALEFSKATLESEGTFDMPENEEELVISNDLHDTPLGRIIGQAQNSYIIVDTDKGIRIIDQHAMAERVLFEKLKKNDSGFKTQGLLIAKSISLTPKELTILEENIENFNAVGFDLEILGSNTVMINGLPDFTKEKDAIDVIMGIIEDIGEEKAGKMRHLEEVKNKFFAYTACRGAVKFGHKLNLFEMNKLLKDGAIYYSSTCPHGRPVSYDMSMEELMKKFAR